MPPAEGCAEARPIGGLAHSKGETPMVDIDSILQSMEQRRSALSEVGNANKQVMSA
jgi:hypothetical protein